MQREYPPVDSEHCGRGGRDFPDRRGTAQSGKSAGLSGAIAGVADTFMAKNRAKTWDAKLAKLTKWVAIGFVVITFVMCLL